MHGGDGVADDDVAGGFLDNGERLQMGTPLLTRVPSVRAKREMATLLTTAPKGGTLSLSLSQIRRPTFVLMASRNKTTIAAMPPSTGRMWKRTASLHANTNTVNPGSLTPMPAKTSLNLGMTMMSNKARMPTATMSTATG